METFEKARLALRKYLLNNKEKVAADLDAMRKKSKGKDLFEYVDSISESLSLENISLENELIRNVPQLEEVEFFDLITENYVVDLYRPPSTRYEHKPSKKDSDILSESFF